MLRGILTLALLLPLAAEAVELPCPTAEKGAMQVDGLTDEWADVQGAEAEGGDTSFSFSVKCNVDRGSLYLLVQVLDNYLVRTSKKMPGEDHLEIKLGGKSWKIYPSDGKVAAYVVGPGLRLQTTPQDQGWAVELSLPRSSIGGLLARFSVVGYDTDAKSAPKTERMARISGDLTFGESGSAVEAFLKAQNLKRGDLYAQKPIKLGRDRGRVLVAKGNLVLVVEDQFVFIGLPVQDRKDLKLLRPIDVSGEGQQAAMIRYLERGEGGEREVLTLYRFPSVTDGPALLFATEVGKKLAKFRLQTKVSFAKRGRAQDLVLQAGRPVGKQDEYKESPASDMIPILLPWNEPKKKRYRFIGDRWEEAE